MNPLSPRHRAPQRTGFLVERNEALARDLAEPIPEHLTVLKGFPPVDRPHRRSRSPNPTSLRPIHCANSMVAEPIRSSLDCQYKYCHIGINTAYNTISREPISPLEPSSR